MAQSPWTGYYTVAQAAQHLGVSRLTILRWIKADKLPAYRIGPRNVRIKREDVDRMVQPVPTRNRGESERVEHLPLKQPSATELARRRALVRRILANREERVIAPLTSVDLIEQVRDRERGYGRPRQVR